MSRYSRTGADKPLPAHAWPWWVAVVGCTLLATLLHLYRLDAKSIWWDESLSLLRAQHSVGYILSNRIDFPGAETIDLHPPLYFLVLRGFVRFWGESDAVLRMPSLLFSSASVPLLYLLGKELRNRRTGNLAALVGALSPFYLWYAQEARMYTMATMLGLLAALCLWRFLTRHSWRWGLAFWAVSAVGIATHYLYALVILGQLLAAPVMLGRGKTRELLLRLWQKSRLRWAAIVFLGMTVLILLTLGRTAWMQVVAPQDGRKYVSLPLMLRDALNSYSLGLTVSVAKVWPLVALFSLTFVAGLFAVGRSHNNPRFKAGACLLLFGYALALPVGMWVYSLVRSLYMGSRYVIMGSPAFYVGVGAGADWLWGYRPSPVWRRILAQMLLLILLGSMVYSDVRYFGNERYTTKEDHRGTAEYVREREQPGDLIIVTAPENRPAFEHYYAGVLPIIGMPTVSLHPTFNPDDLAADLGSAIAGYERVWLVHCRTQHSDPDNQVMDWLKAHTSLIGHRRFPSWGSSPVVDLYRTASPVQPQSQGSERHVAMLGDALALEQATLFGRDDERQVYASVAPHAGLPLAWNSALASGTQLTGEFVWFTREDVADLKTALRLRDERGLVWAQRDRPIIERASSQVFAKDTRLTQDISLVLPVGLPPARYTLELLVYHAETGAPLVLDGEAAALHLADVQVTSAQNLADWAVVDVEDFTLLEQRPAFGATDLVAYSLGPRRLVQGGDASLALYWRARAAQTGKAELVVNWQDSQDVVWHSQSYPLAGLDYPRSAWRKGELVRGLVALQVPDHAPLGEHTLHLLVHDAGNDGFLWARIFGLLPSGRDVLLGSVVVE